MTKVLYLAPYYDGTGYSSAAIDYILSMDKVGIDVVPRPIKLNNLNDKIPQRILELEAKSDKGCDIVIQHCLPNMFHYNSNFKNIGLFAWETSALPLNNWTEKCNLMDEIWVINNHMKAVCISSGVTVPIKVVPHATDVDKFKIKYPKPNCIEILKNKFVFYTIGEAVRRKNLTALLIAFNLEFYDNHNVELIVKTNKNITKDLMNLVEGCKLFRDKNEYKSPFLMSHRMNEDELYAMHQHADCFVTTSYGEAWCIPAFDAIGFGSTPIVPRSTGFNDYMNSDIGWTVDTWEIPVLAVNDSLPGLYTAHSNWYSVDTNDLRKCLRESYENKQMKQEKLFKGIEYVERFSHQNIGEVIKSLL